VVDSNPYSSTHGSQANGHSGQLPSNIRTSTVAVVVRCFAYYCPTLPYSDSDSDKKVTEENEHCQQLREHWHSCSRHRGKCFVPTESTISHRVKTSETLTMVEGIGGVGSVAAEMPTRSVAVRPEALCFFIILYSL